MNTENQLHEQVALTESHQGWKSGIIGYFYRLYVDETLKHVMSYPASEVLEIGCGEGLSFDELAFRPVQMDVSMTRLRRARQQGRRLLCADAYALPFADNSFSMVMLVAILEHTSEPWRILEEAHRVLRPGGRAVIVVPNDVNLSLGRLLLLKFPPRYPDHLTFFTPARLWKWLGTGLKVVDSKFLPFRPLGFVFNLYHFAVVEKVMESPT